MCATANSCTTDAACSSLCSGCGTCVGLCPAGALSMAETPGGLLRPATDPDACTHCGLCTKVCPGTHLLSANPPELMTEFQGPVVAAYLAQAADDHVLLEGQSGGAVTALAGFGMRAGFFAKAAVTTMPADGSLRPRTALVRTEDDLRRAQKSKYCPVAAAAVLGDIMHQPDKVAFVGLPCHVHGLSNATTMMPQLKERIALVLGVFCERCLSYAAMDYIVRRSGLKREDVRDLDLKNKKAGGWPGNICIRDWQGQSVIVSQQLRLQIKDPFTPARCRLCFDKLNVFADLSLGDTWGVEADPRGASVIIVRSRTGAEFLAHAHKAGVLRLREIAPQTVIAGQAMPAKRNDFACFSRAWKETGRPLPDFRLSEKAYEIDASSAMTAYSGKLNAGLFLEAATSRDRVLRWAEKRTRPSSFPLLHRVLGKLGNYLKTMNR